MEYWNNKGQIYNDKQTVLRPLEKVYNLYLSKFGDIKNEDLVMGAIAMGAPMTKVKYLPEILSAINTAKNYPTIEHYINPMEDFRLSDLTQKSLDLLKRNNKPVYLKQNIVGKNKSHHPEIDIEAYNEILKNSLYKPSYIMQVQPNKKPNYYTFINKNKYDTSVLDMDGNKPNYEVVNWFRVNEKRLKDYIKRTKNEGGDFLIND